MEAESAKKYSKVKLVLAGIGVLYLVGAGVWAGQAWWKHRNTVTQPNLAAHPERAGEMLLDREVENISQKLGLTDEQKKQAREIIARANVINAPPAQAMQGMMEARRQIREILTPEQQQKMGEEANARVNRFADRMIERLKTEVGITETQEQGIRNIMKDANPMRAGADTSVPMPQQLMQARERIRGLLTPEQQEKFDRMQGPGGGPGGGAFLRRFTQRGSQQPQEEN